MEFHPSQQTALALAGTVPLPSPYPASGPVSLVLFGDGGDEEVLVKILQVISDLRTITRFVRPEDVRAIRGHPDGAIDDGPESWPVLGIKRVRAALEERARVLRERAGKARGPEEVPWYDAAIVYVLESAPVLHRDEVGVTAAVSSEDVGFAGTSWSGCCHRDSPIQPAVIRNPCCRMEDRAPGSRRRAGRDEG
jgi:hypothetical protein